MDPNPNAIKAIGLSYGGIRGSMGSGGWGSRDTGGIPGSPTDLNDTRNTAPETLPFAPFGQHPSIAFAVL